MDILTEQAAIKAHRQTTRDTSGQFIRPDKALEIRVAGERMKARLKSDADAIDRAQGRVRVHGYWRPIPGYVAPVLDDGEAEVLPVTLLDRMAA